MPRTHHRSESARDAGAQTRKATTPIQVASERNHPGKTWALIYVLWCNRTHEDHREETAMPWGQYAACKGKEPSLWDTDSSPSQQAKGQAICQRCPVRTECLTAALEEDTIHVVRGGVTFSRELAAR